MVPSDTNRLLPGTIAESTDALFSMLNPYRWIVVALIVLHLVPLWFFTYFPSQDGPSHLYNAFIINRYFDSSFPFHEYFSLRLTLFPNWLSHAVLALLMLIFSPLAAEKIMLSIYVVSFPLAVFYFFDAVRPGRHPLALMSFAFIYNYLLFMGFYNFVFSVPLALFALGYWWKYNSHISCRRIIAINVLCMLLFFCHLMTYAITLAVMILISMIHRVVALEFAVNSGHSVTDETDAGANIPAVRSVSVRFLMGLARSVACLLPTIPLLLLYVHNSTINSGAEGVLEAVRNTSAAHLGSMLKELAGMSILKNYGGAQAIVAQLIGLLLLALLIASIVRRLMQRHHGPARAFVAADLFFVSGMALLGLYLLFPFSSGFYGWLNDRLLLVASLMLLGWIDAAGELFGNDSTIVSSGRLPALSRNATVPAICALMLINVLVVSMKIYQANGVLKEYTAAMATMAPHRVVLPLVFGDKTDGLQRSEFLTHASSYFSLYSGGINLDNYETQFDYFPVTFKPGLEFGAVYDPNWISFVEFEPDQLRLCQYTGYIDYLLVWNEPDPITFGHISSCYDMISQNGRQKIYIPKSKTGDNAIEMELQ